MTEQTEKIALITGANKGIGYETAKQLGERGVTVLVGARMADRGREAENKLRAEGVNASWIQLDVTDPSSIRDAVHKVQTTFGTLDILINNAGGAFGNYNEISVPSKTDVLLLRQTFETNFFAMFSVTKAFLPLVRYSKAGRIVNVSSGLGSLNQQSDPDYEFYHHKIFLYNASKTAVNALTVHLAYELRDTPIKVNSADPGFTATDLNGFQGTRTVEQAATIVMRLAELPDNGPTGGFFDENGVVPW